jgi:hypothetical protein
MFHSGKRRVLRSTGRNFLSKTFWSDGDRETRVAIGVFKSRRIENGVATTTRRGEGRGEKGRGNRREEQRDHSLCKKSRCKMPSLFWPDGWVWRKQQQSLTRTVADRSVRERATDERTPLSPSLAFSLSHSAEIRLASLPSRTKSSLSSHKRTLSLSLSLSLSFSLSPSLSLFGVTVEVGEKEKARLVGRSVQRPIGIDF